MAVALSLKKIFEQNSCSEYLENLWNKLFERNRWNKSLKKIFESQSLKKVEQSLKENFTRQLILE